MLQVLNQVESVHRLCLCHSFLDEVRNLTLRVHTDDLAHEDGAIFRIGAHLCYRNHVVGHLILTNLRRILFIVVFVASTRLHRNKVTVLPLNVIKA